MLRTTSLLLPTAAVLAVLPAAPSSAATATFTGTFEAERTISWNQPRGVSMVDCRGENYALGHGSETWKVRTRKPFKVVVSGSGAAQSWTVGSGAAIMDPREFGEEAGGPRTRESVLEYGTTGGWCGGGEPAPPRKSDCGTRLPTYRVSIGAAVGKLDWSMHVASWMANEKTDFYDCWIMTPDGMPSGSFPRLPAKINGAALFNRKKKTIEIGVSKSYGPTVQPVANLGVDRTATGKVRWTLTLTRRKR